MSQLYAAKRSRVDDYNLRKKCRKSNNAYRFFVTKDNYKGTPNENHDYTKRKLNQKVARTAFELHTSSTDEVFALDGRYLRTSFALAQAGYARSRIHVPNNCKEVMEHVRAVGNPYSTMFYDTVNGFLSRSFRRRYALMWLDYCCKLREGKRLNAYADIPLAFQHLRRGKAALAVTFNTRNQRPENVAAETEQVLRSAAAGEGFEVSKYEYLIYHGNMVFAMIHVIHETASAVQKPPIGDESDLGRRMRNVW